MRNILLNLEYDGTDFLGSQIQAVGRTVQGEVERVLQQLTQQETRVTLAGRTDTGVHARGQRANFHTLSTMPLETLQRGLNALLPPDLAVQRVQEVAEDFHARFDARLRVYRYTLYNSPFRSPLVRRYAWQLPGMLEVEAIKAGLALLVGTHDFRSYAAASKGASGRRGTVRTVRTARCWADRPWIYVEMAADGFLRRMVRNVVGELVRLGQGAIDLAGFQATWEAHDRQRAGAPAPPQGLCLERVEYDEGI